MEAFVNFTVDQVHLKNRNPRLMAHIDHTKDRLRTHGVLGFHQTQTSLSRYRVLLHPETLPWLSAWEDASIRFLKHGGIL